MLQHEPFTFLWCKMLWMGKHITSTTCTVITWEKFGTTLLYLTWKYTLQQVPLYFLSIQDVHQ